MNLDAFWQTHRRFLIAVGCGFLVFLIARLLIGATVGADITSAEAAIRRSNATLRRGGFGQPQVAQLRGQVEELRERARELAARSLPPWREEFRPPAGQQARPFYIAFTGSRRSELVGYALRNGLEVDERLGLPTISPDDTPTLEKALRGFDLVDRLVRLAVELDLRALEDIEILVRSGRRARAREGDLLDLTPVTLEVTLDEDRIDPLLDRLATADPPFGLAAFQLLPPDRRRKERTLQLEFQVGRIPPALLGEEEAQP